MASGRVLTASMLCRQVVKMAGDLPWQMKLGVPFHAQVQTELPREALGMLLDDVAADHLAPALTKALANRSPIWGDTLMEIPAEGTGAREYYHGIACRLLLQKDMIMDRMMMALDFEFTALACEVPIYFWLGEMAEAAA